MSPWAVYILLTFNNKVIPIYFKFLPNTFYYYFRFNTFDKFKLLIKNATCYKKTEQGRTRAQQGDTNTDIVWWWGGGKVNKQPVALGVVLRTSRPLHDLGDA